MKEVIVYPPDARGNVAYRVEIRVRNNLIIRKIEAAGFKSIAAFCEKNGLSYPRIISLINFVELPTKNNGDWRDNVYDLSSALHCEPEELFTEQQKRIIRKKNKNVMLVDSFESVKQLQAPESSHSQQVEINETLGKLYSTLSDREKLVVASTALGETFQETGKALELSGQRVRQIDQKATRKMQALIRKNKIQNPFID